jgi:hypothetical protein
LRANALLWIDAKYFTDYHVKSWADVASKGLLGQIAKDAESEEKLRSEFFVYRKEDFLSLRDEINDFWGAVFRFGMFLRMPANSLAKQEFQKLYTLPPIQRALSRLREN